MTCESTEILELQTGTSFPLRPFIPRRFRPKNLGSWSGHLAFANDVVLTIKPSLIVELGTHLGESYFGFCQTVLENGLPTLCYAVDHWLGEAHTGYYGEEVFEDVSHYNDSNYRSFSYLIRSSFDDALKSFSDDEIELLHIDGLHTYDAVRHDFESWFPKVRPGGLVLFHDIAVRHKDFGVWRFWEELEKSYPETFSFHHWWGLGVLRKPGKPAGPPTFLDLCFNSSPEVQERIRRQYAIYAAYLEHTLGRANGDAEQADGGGAEKESERSANQVKFQVFPRRGGSYSEETSATEMIERAGWSRVSFDFPEGFDGPLRIDPADRPCVIEIGEVSVKSAASGVPIWEASNASSLCNLKLLNDLFALPAADRYLLLSYDDDPVIQTPDLPPIQDAVHVEVSLRIDRSFEGAAQALQEERISAERKLMELQTELKSSHSERMILTAQLTQTIAERNHARGELREAQLFIETLKASQASSVDEASEEEIQLLNQKVNTLQLLLDRERAICLALQNSKSWRVTKPLRAFVRIIGLKS